MVIPVSRAWVRGRVEPWWTDQHRELAYHNEDFNDPTAQAQWRELGFTQQRFTGDLYDMRQHEPDWIAPFRDHFDLDNFAWSLYRMGPGTVLPLHSDTYQRFRKVHDLEPDTTVARIIVFLEDWQSGHYLEMDSTAIVNWRAGDWVLWTNDFPHLAANMGSTPRYTLQITGT